MPYYESVFIARQDIAAAQVETLTDEFAQLIKDQGGEIAKREYWGLKNLSFKIKKNRKGHYVLFSLDAPSSAVHEFERVMRYNEDVLRYMTVKVKELDPEPSPMMQPRDERGRGGRRDDRGREDRGRGGGGGRPPRREEN